MSNEIQALHQDATAALVTLDPETYVAAVYKPFSARLEAAIKETEGEKFDIQTTDGLDRAKKCRALFRSIRTEGENERKSRKAPIITIGRMLDSEYEKLKDQVVPHEDKFDAMVKAEEERKEAIKLAKIKREAEVDARIDAIRQLPLVAINMTSAQVQDEIERISQIVPTRDEFDDRDVEAETVINATITQLQSLMSGKKAQEAIAKQLEDQQREAARVDALKGKVQAIKNLILDSAECDTAEQMKALIQKAESEVIDDSYAEFKEEAEAAKQSVITSLGRQYAGLLHAETLAADAEEAARKKIADEEAEKARLEAEREAKIKADGIKEDHNHRLTPKEAAAQIAAAKIPNFKPAEFSPTAKEIVQAVANTFCTNEATAVKWILEADFAELKLAA